MHNTKQETQNAKTESTRKTNTKQNTEIGKHKEQR